VAGAAAGRAVTVTARLRPLARKDAAHVDEWLGTALRAVRYKPDPAHAGAALLGRVQADAALRARVIDQAGQPVGVVVYRLLDDQRATFELIAVPREHARSGNGMQGAALAEDEMRAAGARVAYAPAPAAHGIALYFWIRLGYRPLLRGDWPCRRDGVAWLARLLDA
jgi:hypothetical protein